jgi:AraC-like DNA-binding protein
MELLKDYRLQKAMELLKNNPELGIKEVTYLVGFKERSHFSYSFTKKYNISPSEVRKNG